MDKCKNFIFNNQDKMKFLFLLGAGIAGFNCLTRPDFSLIIYLYIYYIWEMCSDVKEMQSVEKLNSFYFLIFSVLIDVIWTIFWSGRWSHIKDFEKTIHVIVVLSSWIAIGIKVIYVLLIID